MDIRTPAFVKKLPNDLVFENYINARTKTTIKCEICGFSWRIIPKNVTDNTICIKCKPIDSTVVKPKINAKKENACIKAKINVNPLC